MLNNARDIPTCKSAKKLFLSVLDYLDAEQCVAACQEKIDALQEEWEQLRLEQRRKEEDRKIAIKKAKKRILIIGICVLIAALISAVAYVLISRIVVPNAQYNAALEMIEEKKFDDAIALLKEAKETTLLKQTIPKFDEAIEEAKLKQIVEKNVGYEASIRDFLEGGITVHIVYQCEGGILIGSDSNEILYTSEAMFSGLLTSERAGYHFVGWKCEIYQYQEAKKHFDFVFKATWINEEQAIK